MTITAGIRATQVDAFAIISASAAGERNTQLYALTAITVPTALSKTTQTYVNTALLYNPTVKNTQSYVLVAIITGSEERQLRAWTFTQDDHDFYVLQTGSETFVYDMSTQQWCQWTSPSVTYWKGQDGCDWEGWNVCCDPTTGAIYKIDADNRLDYTTTPIVSYVYGGMTERFRNYTPCYMAEVALSEGRPPAGIDATTVGVRLRTYDTLTWTDHGLLQGQATGNMLYARFYGLGLMKSPGVLFEITDYGYARRIDGLNIEMGGTPDGSNNQ